MEPPPPLAPWTVRICAHLDPLPPQPRQPVPDPANYHGHGHYSLQFSLFKDCQWSAYCRYLSYASAVRAPPSSRNNFHRRITPKNVLLNYKRGLQDVFLTVTCILLQKKCFYDWNGYLLNECNISDVYLYINALITYLLTFIIFYLFYLFYITYLYFVLYCMNLYVV